MICVKLNNRACLSVIGDEAEHFLQGLITNDVKKTDENHLIYSLMLSPQGKFLYDFFILKVKNGYMLDVAKVDEAEIIAKLNFYKLRAKVEIVQNNNSVYGFFGNSNDAKNFLKDPRTKHNFYRFYTEKEVPNTNLYQDYNLERIKHKIVCGVEDMVKNESFPLQFNMNEMNSIDYFKGCYVGQEVTARSHHRGQIKKQIQLISGDGNLLKNREILHNNIKVGFITSVEKNFALALIDNDFNHNLTCAGQEVKIL